MNEEIKAKWIAALRSGDYVQGRNGLRKEGKYCCLGVLCDIHFAEVGGSWRLPDDPTDGYEEYSSAGELWEADVLPSAVALWAGLENSPLIHDIYITNLNDGVSETIAGREIHAHSFTEIAELIEKNL